MQSNKYKDSAYKDVCINKNINQTQQNFHFLREFRIKEHIKHSIDISSIITYNPTPYFLFFFPTHIASDHLQISLLVISEFKQIN